MKKLIIALAMLTFTTGCNEEINTECNCNSSSIKQSGVALCWHRCPLGQEWNDWTCEGNIIFKDWCDTTGEDTNLCSSNSPGEDICKQMLGSKYRLPTREEFMELLGNCEESEIHSSDDYLCNSCHEEEEETQCGNMFDLDQNSYWAVSSSSSYSDRTWYTDFGSGLITYLKEHRFLPIRCVYKPDR